MDVRALQASRGGDDPGFRATCAVPGCPPLETIVVFWTTDGKRHHFKLFKPVADVVFDDLPFAWLMDSLILPEGFGCDCC
jgi:nitrate reductase delta subunit